MFGVTATVGMAISAFQTPSSGAPTTWELVTAARRHSELKARTHSSPERAAASPPSSAMAIAAIRSRSCFRRWAAAVRDDDASKVHSAMADWHLHSVDEILCYSNHSLQRLPGLLRGWRVVSVPRAWRAWRELHANRTRVQVLIAEVARRRIERSQASVLESLAQHRIETELAARAHTCWRHRSLRKAMATIRGWLEVRRRLAATEPSRAACADRVARRCIKHWRQQSHQMADAAEAATAAARWYGGRARHATLRRMGAAVDDRYAQTAVLAAASRAARARGLRRACESLRAATERGSLLSRLEARASVHRRRVIWRKLAAHASVQLKGSRAAAARSHAAQQVKFGRWRGETARRSWLVECGAALGAARRRREAAAALVRIAVRAAAARQLAAAAAASDRRVLAHGTAEWRAATAALRRMRRKLGAARASMIALEKQACVWVWWRARGAARRARAAEAHSRVAWLRTAWGRVGTAAARRRAQARQLDACRLASLRSALLIWQLRWQLRAHRRQAHAQNMGAAQAWHASQLCLVALGRWRAARGEWRAQAKVRAAASRQVGRRRLRRARESWRAATARGSLLLRLEARASVHRRRVACGAAWRVVAAHAATQARGATADAARSRAVRLSQWARWRGETTRRSWLLECGAALGAATWTRVAAAALARIAARAAAARQLAAAAAAAGRHVLARGTAEWRAAAEDGRARRKLGVARAHLLQLEQHACVRAWAAWIGRRAQHRRRSAACDLFAHRRRLVRSFFEWEAVACQQTWYQLRQQFSSPPSPVLSPAAASQHYAVPRSPSDDEDGDAPRHQLVAHQAQPFRFAV